MEEVEPEVEQARGDRRAVDEDVLLDQVPAARAHEQRGDAIVEPVAASVRGVERDRAARSHRCRLTWPSTTFCQVGELASSKSAMKTLAPELSALMIILRSAGR